MPSSNASDLTEALMSLPRELLRVPPAGDPLEAMSLGHTDQVNHLVGSEDLTYGELLLDFLLAQVVSPLGARLGESLLLALRPVLVESSFGFLSNMFCPNSFQGTQSPWGFNVSDHSDAHDGRSLDDGDSFDNFLLVDLGTRSVQLPDNVGHARLVPKEAGQVHGFGGVILREGLGLTTVPFAPLLGKKSLGAMARGLKLSVRHSVIVVPMVPM